MSVIVSRALPDVRDGLKPVHRRVLYAMNELGLVARAPVQEVGDGRRRRARQVPPARRQSVYDALVRMVQDFSLRYPLVDGQGNFGSIDGDRRRRTATPRRAHAHRDGDAGRHRQEHRRLRAQLRRPAAGAEGAARGFPNLLVNGSSGIAVGMATNIPPHNLREIVAARGADRQSRARAADLRKFIKGPDFPTGGYIYGRAGIKDYQETGRGRIVMRARAVIEEKESNKSQIVITEMPYQVNKAKLVVDIAELVRDRSSPGISDAARRVRPRRHAHRGRAQARCHSARGAQPAVQAHADAEHVRRDHAGARARPDTRQLVPKVLPLKQCSSTTSSTGTRSSCGARSSTSTRRSSASTSSKGSRSPSTTSTR
jgi:DNA gyrase subunit A